MRLRPDKVSHLSRPVPEPELPGSGCSCAPRPRPDKEATEPAGAGTRPLPDTLQAPARAQPPGKRHAQPAPRGRLRRPRRPLRAYLPRPGCGFSTLRADPQPLKSARTVCACALLTCSGPAVRACVRACVRAEQSARGGGADARGGRSRRAAGGLRAPRLYTADKRPRSRASCAATGVQT